MSPVLIIIILVKDLIIIQWSNSQGMDWLVLPSAWWHTHCAEIIAMVTREMLASVFHLPPDGCQQIGATGFISKGMWVVSTPIVHLIAGFVKHSPHTCAVGCPPLPERQIPAPAVWSH
jgi:hypothetical protein